MNTYIVAYMKEIAEELFTDHYEVFGDGTLEENVVNAFKRYNELVLEDDVYSANVCKVLNSTDY